MYILFFSFYSHAFWLGWAGIVAGPSSYGHFSFEVLSQIYLLFVKFYNHTVRLGWASPFSLATSRLTCCSNTGLMFFKIYSHFFRLGWIL